ncbi:hypothetical protein M501DRAFT_999030 [Patellaria atrata CBS 101060]|uniref:Endoplasmic reticulum lectin n=1 Tax=Patellaria atrata CBS 101060 TaxID=1346257 RepID=A0A9P4S3G4_9PEZI|nr:hypothetical protein M501DRAFT_999030 [Patellaria atrata CBS 101060]
MKNFWALPTFLRLALASAHSFSVTDDLLAFPQYEVIYSDAYVSEEHAAEILSSQDHLANGEPQQSPISASISHSNPHGSGRQSASHDGDEIEHSYQMMIRDSQRFLCDVPHPPPPPPFNQSNTQPTDTEKEEEAKELMRATERGWELLQDMQGQCIYFLSGWWSYSFCYNEGVKQFHSLPPSKNVPVYPPVEDPQVQSYVLGLFPEARAAKEKAQKEVDDDVSRSGEQETGYGGKVKGTDVARLETKGESRYLVQRLGGGTLCDLTNKERRIEVQVSSLNPNHTSLSRFDR